MRKSLFQINLKCSSLQGIESLANSLAMTAIPGELILLSGDLGSGKTTFAKNYIRKLVDDPKLIVNSPSYLLSNTYELIDDTRIHHIDLYRFPKNHDLSMLGIPSIYQNGYTLIEWPERVQFSQFVPYNPLLIEISPMNESRHIILHSFHDITSQRIKQICLQSDILPLVTPSS